MPGRRLSFFCVSSEFYQILGDALNDRTRVSFYVEKTEKQHSLEKINIEELDSVQPRVIWASFEDSEPQSFLGLVQLVPPRVLGNCLCLASFAIKTEGRLRNSGKNNQLYNTMHASIRRHLQAGLWGENTKYGGKHFYKSLYISEGAIAQSLAGRELAPEGGGGYVRFRYRNCAGKLE